MGNSENIFYLASIVLAPLLFWIIQQVYKSSRDKSKERDTFEKEIRSAVTSINEIITKLNGELLIHIKDLRSESLLDSQKIQNRIDMLQKTIAELEEDKRHLMKLIEKLQNDVIELKTK